MSDETAIAIRGVSKSFGQQLIYEGFDLDVKKGETLTVLGPSGSGKSVLLRLIIGLLKPDSGSIVIDGTDVTTLDEHELRLVRKEVAMLFQGAALFDSMDVGENIAYGLREHFAWDANKVNARVAECLEQVGLPGIERKQPAELSGGMQKRVGLARALAPGPKVILWDEPTTGLDPANTRRINELIVRMGEELHVTSIVITHDMASALEVSDRIGLLADHHVELIVDAETARSAPPPLLQAFIRGEDKESL